MQHLEIAHTHELARHLDAPIIIFDLETTTFLGRPQFGITDVHCFAVHPQAPGAVFEYGRLINPEQQIDPRVVQLTGIRQSDVDVAEPWHVDYMQHFAEWADTAFFAGFGSDSFDIPAVRSQSSRYGLAPTAFLRTFDIRWAHLNLSKSRTKKGKLSEVAALYGLQPQGDLHRARCDAHLTLRLLDALCGRYGTKPVADYVVSCSAAQKAAA